MGKVNDMYLKEVESMSDEEREEHLMLQDEEDSKSPELVRMYSLWTEFIKSMEDRFEEKKTK